MASLEIKEVNLSSSSSELTMKQVDKSSSQIDPNAQTNQVDKPSSQIVPNAQTIQITQPNEGKEYSHIAPSIGQRSNFTPSRSKLSEIRKEMELKQIEEEKAIELKYVRKKYETLMEHADDIMSYSSSVDTRERTDQWVHGEHSRCETTRQKVSFVNDNTTIRESEGPNNISQRKLYDEQQTNRHQLPTETHTHRSSHEHGISNWRRQSIDTQRSNPVPWLGARNREEFLNSTECKPDESRNENSHERKMSYSHIAARQVSKELPEFHGYPHEWPVFISNYVASTRNCMYTNEENLVRLEKCLKGPARLAVGARLIYPDQVPSILDTLRMRFGNPEAILNHLVDKIRNEPSVKSDKLEQLITFSISVQNLCATMSAARMKSHLNNPMLLCELVDKLPPNLKLDWGFVKNNQEDVTLADFNEWLQPLAEAASQVTIAHIFQPASNNEVKTDRSNRFRTFTQASHADVRRGLNEKANESNSISTGKCVACKSTDYPLHPLHECEKFKTLTRKERWNLVINHRLCRRCLGGHAFWRCKSRQRCGVDGCTSMHHFLLHNSGRSCEPKKTAVGINTHSPSSPSIWFRVIPVILYHQSKCLETFAFLDEGSAVTLIDEELAEDLDLGGSPEKLCLKWSNGITNEENNSRLVSFEISGSSLDCEKFIISGARTVQRLDLPVQSLSVHEKCENYKHLSDLPLKSYENAKPRLLIGLQHLELSLPLEIREGRRGEPVATRTRLGWTIYGGRYAQETMVQVPHYHICDCSKRDDDLHDMVKNFFSLENFGVKKPDMALESQEDARARKILDHTVKRVDGHFETGLLWRYDTINLPDSLPMAKRRLASLERKMERDPKLAGILRSQMRDYVTKGYARKLQADEVDQNGPTVWYLPMFAVTNPNKPSKVRMVWDAAAEVNNTSLNSVLLKGPDLIASLFDILVRFRERRFAISADIREMFHQIKVRETDQSSQRFLWKESEDDDLPSVFVMVAMTFGATCSPCISQYVKNRNASNFEEIFPRASKAIRDSHYIDDWLESFDSEDDASAVAKDVIHVHAQGGFEIRNFLSNSKKFLSELPPSKLMETNRLNLDGKMSGAKVLGMWWDTDGDELFFSFNSDRLDPRLIQGSQKPTKRQVLRILMMVFDPLGLIAYVLVYVKILLQEIWRSRISWDDEIDDMLFERWCKWLKVVRMIDKIRVPRCYTISPHNIREAHLHVFVDASANAYAAVAYLRFQHHGDVDLGLLSAKTKVAPQSPLSIPRLELQAAVLGVRLAKSLQKALTIKVTRRVFWSDSVNVLSWIRSDHRRYRQFVAHRIGEILETSNMDEWKWVPTKENVADEATKWKETVVVSSKSRWFKGPEFLLRPEEEWPRDISIAQTTSEEELRPQLSHNLLNAHASLVPVPSRFSNWNILVRTQVFINRFFYFARRGRLSKGPIRPDERLEAEFTLFRQAQQDVFANELSRIRNSEQLDATSPVYSWSPFMDKNHILRGSGRIGKAKIITEEVKSPIILPHDHPITRLIANYYHRRYHHHNFDTAVNEIRQRFAIVRIRVLMRKVRTECQVCKNARVRPVPPQMSELPEARLASFTRPFSYVGVDYFGPIEVVVGRRVEKRWGVLYTCLSIRAVHIEIANTLSTDSCIMCLKNFISRRGTPIEVFSDNGTNFKGTSNELKRLIEQIQHDSLMSEFETIKWSFIPPLSPHMGGAWERLIRSIKTTLMSIMPTRRPTDELLRCCLTQAENIVNSRPLTFVPVEPDSEETLTPNHFLLGTSNGSKPWGKLTDDVLVLRRNWQIADRLMDHFWTRWVKEYLPEITKRTKWFNKTDPIKVNDVVVIFDENRRNSWQRGIVLDTIIGRGNQVRQVVVKTSTGIYTRPAIKVAVLDVNCDGGKLTPPRTQLTEGRMLLS